MSEQEPEETERVTMLWPKSMKVAVREVAGPRGLTEFTVAAVEDALLRANQDRPEPAVVQPPAPPVVISQPDKPVEGNPIHLETGEVERPPAERPQPAAEPIEDTGSVASVQRKPGGLFEKVMQATGGELDPSSLKFASEIPAPAPPAQKNLCPDCGKKGVTSELVDGECWECGYSAA